MAGRRILADLRRRRPRRDRRHTYGPRVRVLWRTEALVRAARPANPTLNTPFEDLGIDNLAPHPCVIHPETVADLPPIARLPGGRPADPKFLRGVLPAYLEQACPAWAVDGAPPGGGSSNSLLDTSSEGLDGPWRPIDQPEFSWRDPDDEQWGGHRSPGIWGGRNGGLWLPACSADSSHAIRAEVE